MTEIDVEVDQLLTRRRLVQVGGAAAVGVALGSLSLPEIGNALVASPPAYLRRSSYAKLKGTSFTATGARGAKVTLRLEEIADLARARVEKSFAGRDDAFALTLTGPAGAALDGAIHELRHASLGTFSLFIAPVGRLTATQRRFEVVVDRSMTVAAATAVAPR